MMNQLPIIIKLVETAFVVVDYVFPDDSEEIQSIIENVENRIYFAQVNVSLWAHCCFIDEEFSQEEDALTDELIMSFFTEDGVFPPDLFSLLEQKGITLFDNKPSQENIVEFLLNCFNEPLPIGSVVELALDKPALASTFYEEACVIVASDGKLEKEERLFLNDLAEEFKLSKIDKKRIEKKYIGETRIAKQSPQEKKLEKNSEYKKWYKPEFIIIGILAFIILGLVVSNIFGNNNKDQPTKHDKPKIVQPKK